MQNMTHMRLQNVQTLVASFMCCLSTVGCVHNGESSSTVPRRSGTEAQSSHKETVPLGQLETSVRREEALRAALHYGYSHNYLPSYVTASTQRDFQGDWVVLFSIDTDPRVNDDPFGWTMNWSEIVVVERTGRCRRLEYTHETDEENQHDARESRSAEQFGRVENCVVNADVARLLARQCLVRKGILPTEMTVMQERTDEGGWVIAVTPGVYVKGENPESAEVSHKAYIVHVDARGNCEPMQSCK